ncbi:hypothetical protein LJB83_03020, partial [Clostridia bacterium OttesenSCG-928-F22]|nr:hypothetical protein [Clostridia bacterium OttesenSCG-928-F22]
LLLASLGKELADGYLALLQAVKACGEEQLCFLQEQWQFLKENDAPLHENGLMLSGQDMMAHLHIQAGEQIGMLKRKLFEHCLMVPWDNNQEKLLELLDKIAISCKL